ncbi:hypothetical protein [Streptosporangium amethystogenes]|uniref:hypothetical protein n=1 Tax=Streptosporangium amethystogenes TaxID=2002 RepID=UPI0012FCC421|nr:hypothetical protein [Streptosporangium amethystogenes]
METYPKCVKDSQKISATLLYEDALHVLQRLYQSLKVCGGIGAMNHHGGPVTSPEDMSMKLPSPRTRRAGAATLVMPGEPCSAIAPVEKL